MNVKIRGMPEQAESFIELHIFVTKWMASMLKLEGGVVPLLSRAYRLGCPGNSKKQEFGDIVVIFLHMRDKAALMKEAQRQGCLHYNGEHIVLYQDLQSESLILHSELKPITHK